MTEILSDALLDDFTAALDSAGAAITKVWAPGLSDPEIEERCAPHGIDLPEEARRWWRWHDGVVDGTRGPDWELTPRRPLFTLDQALDSYAAEREDRLHFDGVDRWLPPVGDKPRIHFDCSGDPGDPVAVYTQQDIETPELALPSIGQLVKAWTELIESQVFTTDADGHWNWRYEAIPMRIRQLGIY